MRLSPSRRHLPDLSYCRRAESRFEILAPCRFWWPSPSGESVFGFGQTSNLGIGGVFVSTSALPTLGSPIMFEVDLPRFGTDELDRARGCSDQAEGSPEPLLLLTAEGVVLRYDRAGGGFAASMTQTSFVHQDERKFA